jgi:hypothetical protein
MNKIIYVTCLVVLLFSCKKRESELQIESVNYLKEHNPMLSDRLSKLTEDELSEGVSWRALYTELQEEDTVVARIDVAFFLKRKENIDLTLIASDNYGKVLFESQNVEFLEMPSDKQHYYWDVQFILPKKNSRMSIESLLNIKLQLKIFDKIIDVPQPKKLIRLEGVYVYDVATAKYSLVKKYNK